jgi:hypothetical protein
MAVAPSEPLFRISLTEWSLHRTLAGGRLDHLDFPKVSREDHGIEYSGTRLSESDGIRATKRLLEKIRDEFEFDRAGA